MRISAMTLGTTALLDNRRWGSRGERMPSRCIFATLGEGRLPWGARRWRRRHVGHPLPDRAAVELDGQAVGRMDRALVCPLDPDVAGIVDPAARRLAGIVHQLELGAVLRDEGELPLQLGGAQLDA